MKFWLFTKRFGTIYQLQPRWGNFLKLTKFDIAFTNKAHIIITHVPQVIARTGKGLFYQSEEVVEATHSKFETFWKRYKVLDVESEQHGKNLLECLLDFNTKNI